MLATCRDVTEAREKDVRLRAGRQARRVKGGQKDVDVHEDADTVMVRDEREVFEFSTQHQLDGKSHEKHSGST